MFSGTKNIVVAVAWFLNGLLVVLASAEPFTLPAWIQIAGRAHPLILHLPIAFILLWAVYETLGVFKKTYFQPLLADAFLLISLILAALTAVFGWILSNEPAYDPNSLVWHKWSSIVLSIGLLVVYQFRNNWRRYRAASLFALAPLFTMLIISGHKGAEVTHGEGFLTEPLLASSVEETIPFEQAVAFNDVIKPVLDSKCNSCHNESRAKGKLILTSYAALMRGGKSGSLIDSGVSDLGLLMQRIHLPIADKKHMPPIAKSQLSEDEINLLMQWVKAGAPDSLLVSQLPLADSFRLSAAKVLKPSSEVLPEMNAYDEDEVARLNNTYRVIKPIASGANALEVAFYGRSIFKAEDLYDLEKIRDNILSIHLANISVNAAIIKWLSGCKNLRKLNLANSGIADAEIPTLANMASLQSLTLSGNKITPKGVLALATSKTLRELFVWNAGLEQPVIKELSAQAPTLKIYSGFQPDSTLSRLNMPVIEGDKQIFTDSLIIKIKGLLKGVEVRYTLDDTEPDSLKSLRYDDKIVLQRSATLKVRAFMPGWLSSPTAQRVYIKAASVDVVAKLLTEPADIYKAEGSKTLVDKIKGTNNFRVGYLGFKENDMLLELNFEPTQLTKLKIGSLVDAGNYIMPASQIQVFAGTKTANKLVGTLRALQPSNTVPPYFLTQEVALPAAPVSYIRIRAIPVASLPAWHPGRGTRGWFFTDEIVLE